MRAVTRATLIIGFIIILLAQGLEVSETGKGEVVPDYHLDLDTTIVHLRSEDNNLATFTLAIMNNCVHTLTIRVTVNGPGLSISPEMSTEMVPPYATRSLPIAVAALLKAPPAVQTVDIYSEVTHADGVPVSIKERNASVVVMIHRYQSVEVGPEEVQVEKGKAERHDITVSNTGNSIDYFGLNFTSDDEFIRGYPEVNYVEVEAGESTEFPVVVTVASGTDKTEMDLDFMVFSFSNPDVEVDGKLTVEIMKPATRGNGGVPLGLGLLLLGPIALLFVFLTHLYGWPNSTLKGRVSFDFPSMSIPSSSRCHIIFLVSFSLLISLAIAPVTYAQVLPEIDVTTGSSIQLDASPLTADHLASGATTVIVSSDSLQEMTVEVIVDAAGVGAFGYVKEHRVPPLGSAEFQVSTATMKGSQYRHTVGTVEVRVTEVDGVPFTGISEAQGGFFVLHEPYSLIKLEPKKNAIEIEEGETVTLSFDVSYNGNAMDTVTFEFPGQDHLEGHGFEFGERPEPVELDIDESEVVSFDVTRTEEAEYEFDSLFMVATSEIDHYEEYWCNVILVGKGIGYGDDDVDDDFIPGFDIIIMMTALSFVLANYRRRNGVTNTHRHPTKI